MVAGLSLGWAATSIRVSSSFSSYLDISLPLFFLGGVFCFWVAFASLASISFFSFASFSSVACFVSRSNLFFAGFFFFLSRRTWNLFWILHRRRSMSGGASVLFVFLWSSVDGGFGAWTVFCLAWDGDGSLAAVLPRATAAGAVAPVETIFVGVWVAATTAAAMTAAFSSSCCQVIHLS